VTAARLPCCVPFCRRTIGAEGTFSEWICGRHWRLVDKDLRRLKSRAGAAVRKAEAEIEAINREGYEFALAHDGGVAEKIVAGLGVAMDRRRRKLRQAYRLWERCKRQAIERALGGGEGL
jgi:hypothetical protein